MLFRKKMPEQNHIPNNRQYRGVSTKIFHSVSILAKHIFSLNNFFAQILHFSYVDDCFFFVSNLFVSILLAQCVDYSVLFHDVKLFQFFFSPWISFHFFFSRFVLSFHITFSFVWWRSFWLWNLKKNYLKNITEQVEKIWKGKT